MNRKTILITGSSRGIGKAIAVKYAKKGYNIVINCIKNQELLEGVKKEIESYQAPCLSFVGDVGDEQIAEQLFSEAKKMFGSIDILVNNAGISHIGLLTDMTIENWNHLINNNLTSVFNCCKLAIPDMVKQQQGKIINISSVWGNIGASCEVAYSATKAGVHGLTKALAQEVALSGITVNCVEPGVIDTEMNAALDADTRASLVAETPLCRIGTPEDVAAAVLFFASDAAAFITGQVLGVDGGFAA